jgi:hypothetical protein
VEVKTDQTKPEVMKVLVALAINLRNSAHNLREKEALPKEGPNEDGIMAFQARAMHHALFNAFYVAKKAAGRRKLF